MSNALDLETLASARFNLAPVPWAAYDNVFQDNVLLAAFPMDHFEEHAQRRLLETLGKQGTEAWYQHNVETRPLLNLGQKDVYEPEGLDEAWLGVADDLLSAEYRECISEVTGHDVRSLELQAHFWRFKEGSFFTPHVDKPHKIVTHLMYLNDEWFPEMGGVLQIHGSSSPDDVLAQIPPRKNTGVLLKRTDNAWHSVSRIPLGKGWTRRVLQVWFWQS
jgi:hypothetical protein